MKLRSLNLEILGFAAVAIYIVVSLVNDFGRTRDINTIKSIYKRSEISKSLNLIDIKEAGNGLRVRLQGKRGFTKEEFDEWTDYFDYKFKRYLAKPATVQILEKTATIKDYKPTAAQPSLISSLISLLGPASFYIVAILLMSFLPKIKRSASNYLHQLNKMKDQKTVIVSLQKHQSEALAMLEQEKRRNTELQGEVNGIYNLWTNATEEIQKLRQLTAPAPKSKSKKRREEKAAVTTASNETVPAPQPPRPIEPADRPADFI